MSLYVTFKKLYDDEGELAGLHSKFVVMAQEEIDDMDDEELEDFFLIPLREASECKSTGRFIMPGNSTKH